MWDKLIFELSRQGQRGVRFPQPAGPPVEELLPTEHLRSGPARLPEVSESDLARHFEALGHKSFGVDSGFYPLGSCTMKHNPKVCDRVAALAGIARLHPLQPAETVQGALRLMATLETALCQISGMAACSLQPPAGAAGEYTSLRMIRAYHDARGDTARRRVLVPDTAHGTNPASAARTGMTATTVVSNEQGEVDLDDLKSKLGPDVAALMLTNPNTLGLFERHVVQVVREAHAAGALVYCDGANMNAILARARPGDMGFDALHFNLHKTFATPHGGGGPGSGPITVSRRLVPFLPVPRIVEEAGRLRLSDDFPQSIGKVHAFWGHFAVAARAYTYIRMQGAQGLRRISGTAVLNANYLLHLLRDLFQLPYDRPCMHEFVLSAQDLRGRRGVHAIDIGKRLTDFGFHAPTINFPLIVKEALMIEPTETESRSTLERFAEALRQVREEAEAQPDLVKTAPHRAPVKRLDEVKAAREPDLRSKE